MSGRRLAPEEADRVFGEAMARFEAGAFDEAARLCRTLQTSFPRNAAVLQLYGLVELRRGNGEEARAKLARAIELVPDDPEALSNYAGVLSETGRPALAAETFRKAATLAPDSAQIATNLVIALRSAGRHDDAWTEFVQALARFASHLPLLRAGLELAGASGDPVRIASAAHALTVAQPEEVQAHAALGHACLTLGRDDEALASFERWAVLAPGDPAAHDAIGIAQQRLQRFDAALIAHFRALELAPRDGGIMLNLGTALDRAGKTREAEAVLRRAAGVPEKSAAAFVNLAALRLRHDADIADALALYEQALERAPNLPEARLASGMLRLRQGEFARGFDLIEARFETGSSGLAARRPGFIRPRWQGEPLVGKTLLVWREGGVLTDLVALHALGPIVERAARVIVQVDERLAPLLRRVVPPSVEIVTDDAGTLVARHGGTIDYHAPAGDLVRHLYRAVESVTPRERWLAADVRRAAEFRARYAAHGASPIVGLAWRGDPLGDAIHALPPLDAWHGLLGEPDSVFISLEAEGAGPELQSARAVAAATLVSEAGFEPEASLDELAARLAGLDLVIGVDNVATRLAAALGVETWLILPPVASWVWFEGRSDSPWSRRIRLFAAAKPGVWAPTLAEVAQALARRRAES